MSANKSNEIITEDSDHDIRKALVFVIGSSRCKIGFASEDRPRYEILSVVGRLKEPDLVKEFLPKDIDVFMCDDAHSKKEIVNLEYPIERGIVTNWRDMEHIWHHAFYTKLQIPPEDQPILLAEIPLNPKANRDRMMEMLFNEFLCPAVYIMTEPVLVLYSTGNITGCVLDIGDSISFASCVIEGELIHHSSIIVNFGGKDLTKYLMSLLKTRKQRRLEHEIEDEIIQDIKECCCFTAKDLSKEIDKAKDTTKTVIYYELPDGNSICLNDERFQCPEALFNPELTGREELSIVKMVVNSIAANSLEIRPNLYSNIALSGGSSMFQGLDERLQSELRLVLPENEIHIIQSSNRKNGAWVGGSILASLATFQSMWITKEV